MVTYFGMSKKIGNISFYDSTGQSDMMFTKPYSEKTAELIDKEVNDIVDAAYKRAINILKENKEKLTQLAEILLEKEVIFSDNLEKIFGKRKGKTPEELMENKEEPDEKSEKDNSELTEDKNKIVEEKSENKEK